MTKTVAVVGAGPGVGLSTARLFGSKGFRVALIARNAAKLAGYVDDLRAEGIDARAHPADIADHARLAAALEEIGAVDVLVFGPNLIDIAELQFPTELTVESVQRQLDIYVLGAITAVRQVLPGMRERGEGTLLFSTGASAAQPVPMLANLGIAMAGLRNWVHTLNAELAPTGIHAGTLTVCVRVEKGAGEADPDAIAARHYAMYTDRDRAEEVIGDLAGLAALVKEQLPARRT
ncbi:SDR family oxidoreductase [Allokutzneria sp. A3M-2-11 16]|uniref:SDR family NAD(P)-dependent oxidoreductase n=1 Tax=Allokutzneria sp. A3M-2-11 16 TaxID=2962043 RepID=UPI0020B6EB81|nr:SDR family NAD(P)-dependent oxidoreductase [Allokutzneria sp. A3M-2-11 16]MCP3799107.1 SDR family oxidoreductase [Allokutzneria sp. A3M-2-11 16]